MSKIFGLSNKHVTIGVFIIMIKTVHLDHLYEILTSIFPYFSIHSLTLWIIEYFLGYICDTFYAFDQVNSQLDKILQSYHRLQINFTSIYKHLYPKQIRYN
ncbi:hypothetical protein I4U23_005422 [Adineta vaga]|nr:hypothetical protein I4U23_005422 [Adineta vaga]